MENTEQNQLIRQPEKIRKPRTWLPFVLVLVGVGLLLNEMNTGLPYWLVSWQMLLIGIGVVIGITSGFRDPKWFILILVGGIAMFEEVYPGFAFHRFLWPIGLILIGLFMLFRPKRGRRRVWDPSGDIRQKWQTKDEHNHFGGNNKTFTSENYFDSNVVFGGSDRMILSKDFKGGEINVFMGGTELNFSQADIHGTARLEINQMMGGTKIIVPPQWEIRSEINSVFGSVEDKRQQTAVTDPGKVLIIEGNSFFGGIEIRNY